MAALLTLVFVIMVNLALGILPRVDNFAHIGGLISGFLLGFVFFVRPQFDWLNQRRVSAAAGAGQPSPPAPPASGSIFPPSSGNGKSEKTAKNRTEWAFKFK